jgi:hypothetical protein
MANLLPNPDEHCTYAAGCTRGYEHVTPLGLDARSKLMDALLVFPHIPVVRPYHLPAAIASCQAWLNEKLSYPYDLFHPHNAKLVSTGPLSTYGEGKIQPAESGVREFANH